MSQPPPEITFVFGDDIELLTILKFESNPSDHLEAVWESTFNEVIILILCRDRLFPSHKHKLATIVSSQTVRQIK